MYTYVPRGNPPGSELSIAPLRNCLNTVWGPRSGIIFKRSSISPEIIDIFSKSSISKKSLDMFGRNHIDKQSIYMGMQRIFLVGGRKTFLSCCSAVEKSLAPAHQTCAAGGVRTPPFPTRPRRPARGSCRVGFHTQARARVHIAWRVPAGAGPPASATTNGCGDALCPVALWRLQARAAHPAPVRTQGRTALWRCVAGRNSTTPSRPLAKGCAAAALRRTGPHTLGGARDFGGHKERGSPPSRQR